MSYRKVQKATAPRQEYGKESEIAGKDARTIFQTKRPPFNAKTKRHMGDTREFRAEVRSFARRLGRDYAEEWERNPRKARELAVQCLRKYLPHARLGRPCSADVTRALELRKQGKGWPEIYGKLIADEDSDRRSAKQLRLRAAVRSRLRYPKRTRAGRRIERVRQGKDQSEW